MAQAHDQPVIIVKKHRGGHGGHHGGAWKVAYADFVTAMMAFFLVMWLVAQSKPIKASIGGYFRDPGIFEQQKSNGAIPGGNGGILPDGVPKTAAPTAAEEAHEALKQAGERIHDRLAASPEFKALRDQVDISLTDEGLRVQLLESSNSSFFDSGSPTLKGESVQLLKLIAAELSKQNNEIAIEGHTDSRPYTGGVNYTNWELSADRANAARRAIQADLKPHQLRAVRGYADTLLRIPADPYDPRNRRVSIIVRNTPEKTAQ
jgi:chemotaxis protein MotB